MIKKEGSFRTKDDTEAWNRADILLYLTAEQAASELLLEQEALPHEDHEISPGENHEFSQRFMRRQRKLIHAVSKRPPAAPARGLPADARLQSTSPAALAATQPPSKRPAQSWRRRMQTAAAAVLVVLLVGVTATAAASAFFKNRKADETELNWGLDGYSLILEPVETDNPGYSYKTQPRRVLLEAVQGSDEYNALAEWKRFMDEYEMTDDYEEALFAADVEGAGRYDSLTEREKIYEMYGCYDDNSAQMLESIADKYHLELLNPPVYYTTPEQCETIYEQWDIFADEEAFLVEYGYSFEDGSMHCEFDVSLDSLGQIFGGSLTIARKGSMYPYVSGWSQGSEDEMREVGYITASGAHVDIAATKDSAWVFYEGEESCIFISFPKCYWNFFGRTLSDCLDIAKELADMIEFSNL